MCVHTHSTQGKHCHEMFVRAALCINGWTRPQFSQPRQVSRCHAASHTVPLLLLPSRVCGWNLSQQRCGRLDRTCAASWNISMLSICTITRTIGLPSD